MELKWPERPLCHDQSWQVNGPFAQFKDHLIWRAPDVDREPYSQTFRTCGYCGSIHPADLLDQVSKNGATLSGSDWKYGWPRKFYVEGIINPHFLNKKKVKTGSGSWYATSAEDLQKRQPQYELRNIKQRGNADHWEADIYHDAPRTVRAKWYNEHLLDLDDECFAVMSDILFAQTNIRFKRVNGDIEYEAPHRGYQK